MAPGTRVAVPFGSRREVGVVVGLSERPEHVDPAKVRPVLRALDPEPLLGTELLELTRWMARRYACSWGEALAAVLPATLKRERGTRQVLVVSAVPGVGPGELAQIEERFPKQHRLLRTLLELSGPVELREILRRLNLGESPARSLARKGWALIEKVPAAVDLSWGAPSARVRPETLSAGQSLALAALARPLEAGEAAAFLLQGVTGSGKTEVYLRLIEQALERGRGAIAVVPEICLLYTSPSPRDS